MIHYILEAILHNSCDTSPANMPSSSVSQAAAAAAAAANAEGPPRRRSRAREDDQQASLFLRKAYHVVSNCPPNLGGWSANGETFIVKNAKIFSEKVIPTVYKHNNFSSFVRQLNFYGFKKVKLDLSSVDNPWWEFQHPKFLRGMPQLLREIKRVPHCAVLTDRVVSAEADELKSTVTELREKLAIVDKSIIGLTKLVQDFMRESATYTSSESSASLLYDGDPLAAGRKRSFDSGGSQDTTEDPHRQYQRTEMPLGYAGPPLPHHIDTVWNEEDDDDSLNELLTLQKEDHEGLFPPDLYTESSDADFDDFLSFVSTFDDEGITNGKAKTFAPIPEERKRAHKLSAITAPVTVHDIPFFMTKLPTSTQARFLDKFAESAGMHFTEIITQRTTPIPPNTVGDEESPAVVRKDRTLSQQQILYEKIFSLESSPDQESKF